MQQEPKADQLCDTSTCKGALGLVSIVPASYRRGPLNKQGAVNRRPRLYNRVRNKRMGLYIHICTALLCDIAQLYIHICTALLCDIAQLRSYCPHE